MELYLNKLAAALGTQLDGIVTSGYPVQKVHWDRASMFLAFSYLSSSSHVLFSGTDLPQLLVKQFYIQFSLSQE